MNFDDVDLTISAVRRSQYPDDNLPEFVMLGRSNVGKSSFMNTLVNRKNLARISSKPGKTSTINFYNVDKKFYLVDVPGYGYADTSKEEIRKFGLMVEEYLEKRETLKRVFLLIDFRHKPTNDDVIMYNFLKYYQIPVTIVATKADKVSSKEKEKNLKIAKETLDIVVGDNLVLFSSISKLGREEVLTIIQNIVNSK
ncbi:MAG: YihA family ribosome biogenesis GTP-binding protein [Bacilli bacterium]|nr:YihA family ribosome biogenesis GTP-binding protein [Bacilli bacterium]